MKTTKLILISFLLNLMFSCGIYAQDSATNALDSSSVPKSIEAIAGKNRKIVKTFSTVDGIRGYILSDRPGSNIVAYTFSGLTDVAVVGSLINSEGENLTTSQIDKYGTVVNFDDYRTALGKAPGFEEKVITNTKKSEIWVFVDPNCIYCHLLWEELGPYKKAGLDIHWIVVGFLKPDSSRKAAALLSAKNPVETFNLMEKNFDEKLESGAIEPKENLSKEERDKLISNYYLFASLGFAGTPGIVYSDTTGKLHGKAGIVPLAQLPALLRLPYQDNTLAELQKYR